MEFDLASKRLQREQQRSKQTTIKKKNMSMHTTPLRHPNDTKEMQLQQKQLRQQQEEKRQKERQQKQYETQLLNMYMQKYDSKLRIQSLMPGSAVTPSTPFQPSLPMVQPPSKQQQYLQHHLQLIPVSIHGNGDKITLPPSLLERLLQQQEQAGVGYGNESQPWTFRIGIRNPLSLINPISNELQSHVQENFRKDDSIDAADEEEEEEEDEEEEEEEDAMEIEGDPTKTRNRHWRKKEFLNDMSHYMNELQHHQYISYTHGTVIEFTQEEGYIGIPKAIADSLLLLSTTATTTIPRTDIERTRTVDPAAASTTAVSILQEKTNEDETVATIVHDDVDEEKTPGHVAYNAFDIPAVPIEIVLLQLPKGTGMTLRPITRSDDTTKSFYLLQQDQVKYALEQSIQRTRATITLYDTLTTWYRGNEYQFLVTKLTVASSHSNTNVYDAISCINTDIEIDFEPINMDDDKVDDGTTNAVNTTTKAVGRRLMDEPITTATTTTIPHRPTTTNSNFHPPSSANDVATISLPPEPSTEEKQNIITIQFRYSSHNRPTSSTTTQRRFNITTTTIRDLFYFVQHQQRQSTDTATFGTHTSQQQLVRRYPRRIFTNNDDNVILQDAGFQSGNELLIVEEN